MAITTLDGVVAGTQPTWPFTKVVAATAFRQWQSLWSMPGWPLAGTYNTTLNGGTYSSTSAQVTGAIPHFDPGGGVNSYLARLTMLALTTNTMIWLCDRLWDNGGISVTSTSAQSIVSPTWPARDVNGATAGAGVLVGLEASAVTANSSTVTLGYTNSAGTAGHTAAVTSGVWTPTVQGGMALFPQAAGDFGVQSVQSLTLTTSMVSGTINLFAFRVIAGIDGTGLAGGVIPRSLDAIKGCFQRIYNGTVPFFVCVPAASSTLTLNGTYQETQG